MESAIATQEYIAYICKLVSGDYNELTNAHIEYFVSLKCTFEVHCVITL